MWTIANLIKAMTDYACYHSWTDTEFIDALVGLGVTEQDFIDCGYGNFVKEYFSDN